MAAPGGVAALFASLVARAGSRPVRHARAVVRVAGVDAPKFLQNVIANDATAAPVYTAMLNHTGRVLNEAFLRPTKGDAPTFLFDAHADSAQSLLAELRKMKLRAKITIDDVTDQWAVLVAPASVAADQLPGIAADGLPWERDFRAPDLWMRAMVPRSDPLLRDIESRETDLSYDLMRMLRGIPEGPIEVPTGQYFPFELNMDYSNGGACAEALHSIMAFPLVAPRDHGPLVW